MPDTARERLIDKLADEMDRDNATVCVDEVIVEALEQLREMGDSASMRISP